MSDTEPLVAAPSAGDVLADRYVLEAVLGQGGMGTVWRAFDRRLARLVAIKLVRPDLGPGVFSDLQREALAAARIADHRVVTVLDLEHDSDGNSFIVLEHHDGGTLADELQDGPLPPPRFDLLARDLLGALQAAHDAGVLHRDIKPANVLARPDGYRITDFGLASLDDVTSESAARLGTPVYVAPERLAGRQSTVRSDVFSAAVVLHEALTGQRTIDEVPVAATAVHTADGRQTAGPIPSGVLDALRRGMQPDPRQRPRDVAELSRAFADRSVEPHDDATVVLDDSGNTAVLPIGPEIDRDPPDIPEPVPVALPPREPARSAIETPVEAAIGDAAVAFHDRVVTVGHRLRNQWSQSPRERRISVAVAVGVVLLLIVLLSAVGDRDAPAGPDTAGSDRPVATSLDDALDQIAEVGR